MIKRRTRMPRRNDESEKDKRGMNDGENTATYPFQRVVAAGGKKVKKTRRTVFWYFHGRLG